MSRQHKIFGTTAIHAGAWAPTVKSLAAAAAAAGEPAPLLALDASEADDRRDRESTRDLLGAAA